MYEVNRLLYKINGSNKKKLEELTDLMLKIKVEPVKINDFYSIELFLDYQEIDVPRHLIVGDITLTLVVFSQLEFLGETTIYYNGLVSTKIDYFSYIILRANKILSYFDFVLYYFENRFSKAFNQSLTKIEDTNLYYSIIAEAHGSFTKLLWLEKTNIVMNPKFQKYHDKFEIAANLDVKKFVSLFI